jgi:hypothetical protein
MARRSTAVIPEQRPKSPVDLPLRLDDAEAPPTTPQGQQQRAVI